MNKIHATRSWLLAAAICALVHAAPPTLEIDSLPVAATCGAGTGGEGGSGAGGSGAPGAGSAQGAALLRPAQPTPAAGGPIGDLYQSTMELADWGGHFARYALAGGTAGAGAAASLAWDAGAILTGAADRPPMPAPQQRQIYTSIVQQDGALMMAPFNWPSLSAAQQALLDLEDQAGEQRLAYLRGDRTLEGTRFRRRSSILGDAVHSTPVYVGPPDRRSAVFLGTNDGMLHAFDAANGAELFAYVPDALIAQLHHLTDPNYQHRAYVDGPASAGEASIGGGRKTILLSAMGGGAQGVLALDITDPAHFADGLGALWEFTSRDDPMMGNVTTIPQIAKVRLRQDVYRYFAIVPSGINNGGDGKGALFLLALDKARDEGWKRDSNYYRITTPIAEASLPNALSAPVLLNDSAGALRYAYAGDLQGNLWRFDFSGSTPWAKAISKPLFIARDASGRRQPITQQPLLAYANVRGYMVLFGTGRMIEQGDRSSAASQSYYAIIDSLQTPPDIITGRKQLTQRFLDGSDMRMEPGSKGWYIDFTQPGERSINTGVLADGAVLFNTVLPGASMCSPTRSRAYALNVISGLPDDGNVIINTPQQETITGLMLPGYVPSPSLLRQSITRGPRDAIGRIRQEKSYTVVQVTEAGHVSAIGSMRATRRTGRLSWREIANWRELHEAAK
ncbi:pilus assembly protein PilY [Pseudoduganella sp. FT55W]|uniref:Pilus assembly protein PilY n=1 Tax=Duganella rivi TaxID=2666083 RepID=A0A7X4GRL9_9BURK|nr:PilC/PilY family type IV pilus protein [Duganella rivi]MYM68283.1 pilus assembly protein PilY [Duganella rivi]